MFLFDLSKVFEFVDTIFIVLRKKPLIFLHYYHHVSTMLFCWYCNQTSQVSFSSFFFLLSSFFFPLSSFLFPLSSFLFPLSSFLFLFPFPFSLSSFPLLLSSFPPFPLSPSPSSPLPPLSVPHPFFFFFFFFFSGIWLLRILLCYLEPCCSCFHVQLLCCYCYGFPSSYLDCFYCYHHAIVSNVYWWFHCGDLHYLR